MPITRSRGNPVTCFVTQHITSSGFEPTRTIASVPTLPAPTTGILFIRRRRSPAAGVHLPMGIGAQRLDPVQRAAIDHAQSLFGAAIGAALPRGSDERRQLLVADAAAQRSAQIDALAGVETQKPGAIRGDTAAVAGPPERRGDRGDDPEGRAVREAEPLGGGAPGPGGRGEGAVRPW